nr:PaaI family thioesterase [Angustibacter aerolatus]
MSTPSDTSSLGAVGEAIGIRFDDPTGARVEATWTVGPAVHQPAGILHGGVHSWVVETLASVGAQTWLGDDGHVVGVNNSTDFYRAVRDGEPAQRGDAGAPGAQPAGVAGRDARRRRPAGGARPGAVAEPARRLTAPRSAGAARRARGRVAACARRSSTAPATSASKRCPTRRSRCRPTPSCG